jgi:antitoxin ParD1/3/4
MPDAMSDYIASRVETGQYGNVSEYFRDLVRREQQLCSRRSSCWPKIRASARIRARLNPVTGDWFTNLMRSTTGRLKREF